jgi:NAD(P)H dehydrogenase (quinone)
MGVSMSNVPVVLLLGATGQLGNLIAQKLRQDKSITLRVCARDDNKLSKLRSQFEQAVKLDLDEPRTFESALEGVDRAFLLTGYTFGMVTQSKTFVDAARKAKVKHLVQLGVYTPEFDCTDPHFAWHQMIQAYIKQSGVPWTFLHPNVFMQNLTGSFGLVKNGKVRWWCGDTPCGWIALEDVAEAAAKILIEGEKIHASKEYWFSTEVLTLTEIARVLSEVAGHTIQPDPRKPEQVFGDMGIDEQHADPYFIGVKEFCQQVVDGRMSYIGTVRDDMKLLFNRSGLSVRDWAALHKEELIEGALGERAAVR